MDQTHDILYQNESVGTARMEQMGLYIHFSCRCRLHDDGLYRIHVISGEHREDLGICVPVDGAFGMDKKIPTKRLGEGIPRFELLTRDWKPQEIITAAPEVPVAEKSPSQPKQFISVSEEEPFEYLDKLENAVLAEQEDKPGIVIQMPEQE